MSYLLTEPHTVLAAGFDDATLADLTDALLAGTAEQVEPVAIDDAVTTRDGSLGTLAVERDDVGCVVVGDHEVDPDVASEHVRQATDLLPVVAVVANGSEHLAHRFTDAGGDAYVPQSAGFEAVRTAVDGALESFVERRDEHAQSRMFDSLLDNVALPLYAKDESGRYVKHSVVPAGKDPESVIGKTDPEIYDVDLEASRGWLEDDLSVIETGEGIFDEEECYDTDAGEFWSRTTKVPWYEDDDPVGLVGVSFDITEYVEYRYRLEEYRDRFEKFADSVTHDIHNPLQVASGNLELARETDDEEAFDRAADALDRIDEMLEDLSDIATEEQQTLSRSMVADRSYETLSLDPVELVALVEDVWKVLEPEDAHLEIELPPQARIYGPDSALRTVVENLLKNAIRHAGPNVTVRVGHLDDGGFYVEDDGPGIPEANRASVFDEGFTTAEEGSGTGLAIVSDIARSQNWLVDVDESDLGGVRFSIYNCLFVSSSQLHDPVGETVALDASDAIGDYGVDSAATYDEESGEWTVTGGGTNIWQETNEFFYVHATMDSPTTIQGRVLDIEDVGEYSKAGLMVRDSLDEDATYGHIGMIPDSRTEVLWRTRTGEDGVSQFVERTEETRRWFRVDRVGETVTLAVSSDGEEWTPVNERRVELTDPIHVGLVVCSYRPNTDCTGVFDNVSVRRLDVD